MACSTWPYHISRRQQRTDVMSSMPSFSSGEAEGVSSLFDATNPMDHDAAIAAEPPNFCIPLVPTFRYHGP